MDSLNSIQISDKTNGHPADSLQHRLATIRTNLTRVQLPGNVRSGTPYI